MSGTTETSSYILFLSLHPGLDHGLQVKYFLACNHLVPCKRAPHPLIQWIQTSDLEPQYWIRSFFVCGNVKDRYQLLDNSLG